MKQFLNERKEKHVLALALGAGLCLNALQPAQAQPVYATDLTNIAAAANGGRVLSVTSTIDDDTTFSADTLIDGQVHDATRQSGTNGWASNKFDPVNMEKVTIGFAGNAQKKIGKIVISPAAAVAPERWAKDVEVQVSTEGAEGPYRPIAQLTLKRSPERQEFTILPANARFVRLVFRSNWGSDRAVALGEVEIYESIGNTDPIGQLIGRLEGAINDLKRYGETQAEVNNAIGTRTASVPQSKKTTAKAQTVNSSTRKSPARSLEYVPSSSKVKPQLIQDGTANAATAGAIAGTAPASSSNGRAVNIAAASNGGKIVDVSSVFSNDPLYTGDNLIDGQNYSFTDDKGSYGWSSEGFSPGKQYVTIGFRDDRSRLISKVVLNPVSNQSALRWASRVEMQISNDSPKDGPFRTIATFNIRQEASNQDFTFRPVEAKYVRFLFTANGPGNPLPQADPSVSSDRAVSLGEIEIYELPSGTGELNALVGKFNQVLVDLKTLRAQNKITTPEE